MSDPSAHEVVELYERHARAWIEVRERFGEQYCERGWLDRFAALLPPGGTVLDLGCGAGAPMAADLAGRGLRVTGVDASPALVARFRERLPEHQALVGDLRSVHLDRRFDGVLLWDSLFHLTPADQRTALAVAAAHAGQPAAVMFNSGSERGESIGRFEGEPLYHASLNAAEYRALLEELGFEVVDYRPDDPTCGGRSVWLARKS